MAEDEEQEAKSVLRAGLEQAVLQKEVAIDGYAAHVPDLEAGADAHHLPSHAGPLMTAWLSTTPLSETQRSETPSADLEVSNGYTNEAECRASLEAAVIARCMADVEIGLLLSGGLDSSIIGAIMLQVTPSYIYPPNPPSPTHGNISPPCTASSKPSQLDRRAHRTS
jgi:hypothetical protein